MPKSEGLDHIHDHGDTLMQGEDTSHADNHDAHSHDDTANIEHAHDADPDYTNPSADSGMIPKKAGHTHALGTPPHGD